MTNHPPTNGPGGDSSGDEQPDPRFGRDSSFDDTLRVPKGRRVATDGPNEIWADRRPLRADATTGRLDTAGQSSASPFDELIDDSVDDPIDATGDRSDANGSTAGSTAATTADRIEPLPVRSVDVRSVDVRSVDVRSVDPPVTSSTSLSILPDELVPSGRAEKRRSARRGFAGFFNRVSGGLLSLRPGSAEAQELSDADSRRGEETQIRQATWNRAVSILVANRKGGVGKTPTALILGGVLASIRGGSVAVLEVTDDPGALGYRAEGSPPRGLGELVRDVDSITSAGQLAGYTAPQTSFASVIASTGHRAHLTAANVIAVSGLIDEFYAIRVMDSGNQPTSSAFMGAVEVADVLVIPVLNAGDAVLEAVALLDHLRSSGPKGQTLADGAIVVRLTDGRPEDPKVMTRIDRVLTDANPAHVLHVPFDAHIAERGQITLATLEVPTVRAFTGIAERVVERLVATVR